MKLLDFVQSQQVKTSDKYDLGYIHQFYNRIFTPLHSNNLRLLEIGIYYGQSLKLWHNYFSNAEIFGVDIDNRLSEEFLSQYPRLKTFTDDAYSSRFLNKLEDESFDIIIDDGSHTVNDQRYFLQYYPKKLKKDGILILEDIIDVRVTSTFVEMLRSFSRIEIVHMANKCIDPNLNIRWSRGLDVIIAYK